MTLEAAHEALLGTLRKQVHDLVVFEIYEDRGVGAALLERDRTRGCWLGLEPGSMKLRPATL
jgi:hypothetical protein